MATIGENIRRARINKGITQDQLAAALNTSKSAISKYELGHREPRIDQLKTIASYLNIDLFDLIPDEHKQGFEHIPSYFTSEQTEEREKAHTVEEILLSNALNIAYYQKLELIASMSDKAIEKPLRELDEAILKSVLLGSFSALTLRGKYEAVERVAELELVPRFSKKRTPRE